MARTHTTSRRSGELGRYPRHSDGALSHSGCRASDSCEIRPASQGREYSSAESTGSPGKRRCVIMTRFKKSLRRNRPSYFGKKIGLVFGAIAVLSVGSYFSLPPLFKTTYAPSLPAAVDTAVLPEPPKVVHLPTPEPLKAIYMTSCV